MYPAPKCSLQPVSQVGDKDWYLVLEGVHVGYLYKGDRGWAVGVVRKFGGEKIGPVTWSAPTFEDALVFANEHSPKMPDDMTGFLQSLHAVKAMRQTQLQDSCRTMAQAGKVTRAVDRYRTDMGCTVADALTALGSGSGLVGVDHA